MSLLPVTSVFLRDSEKVVSKEEKGRWEGGNTFHAIRSAVLAKVLQISVLYPAPSGIVVPLWLLLGSVSTGDVVGDVLHC